MNRDHALNQIVNNQSSLWDIIIIGGGATGVGIAVDAASRGYKTVLFEQRDFASGTSSRSTKLIHGGVRYLRQGNFNLVKQALEERNLLIQNASHLVNPLPFTIPIYKWVDFLFYGTGLKLYDWMAGKQGIGNTKFLTKDQTIQIHPTINTDGLKGGIQYYDGQFDDARMVIHLAQTAVQQGATVLNYMKVVSLVTKNTTVCGVEVTDVETGKHYSLQSKAVINATGAFCDAIRALDGMEKESLIRPSQGSHLILDSSFLPNNNALMIPKTEDNRVLFAIPWHNRVIVGTTDIPVSHVSIEPKPFEKEIEYLLSHLEKYLTKKPSKENVLCVFTGIRPLINQKGDKQTSSLSRDHLIIRSDSGLITVTGGKWTTYRLMAEHCINRTAEWVQLPQRSCKTKNIHIHSCCNESETIEDLAVYGLDAISIQNLLDSESNYRKPFHPEFTVMAGEVIWMVRHEMARTVEDVLARRTFCLYLNAKESINAAYQVAKIMASELGQDDEWQKQQITKYKRFTQNFLISKNL